MKSANETAAKPNRCRCEKCRKVKVAAETGGCGCHDFGFCAECVASTTEAERHDLMTEAWTEYHHARHCDMWFPREAR